MKALQYRTIGQAPEVVEIETPEPGPGQVRLKVTAAGVCHSDEFIMGLPEDQYVYGLPLTLGHEGAGIVDKLGDGVKYIEEGDVGGRLRSVGLRALLRVLLGTGELLPQRRPIRYRASRAGRTGFDGRVPDRGRAPGTWCRWATLTR